MSSLALLNMLAYSAVALFALSLFYVGSLLLRPGSTSRGLAALLGESQAREFVQNRSLTMAQIRGIGILFLLLGSFIAVCIARDLQHV
jgi:hypothetical protein